MTKVNKELLAALKEARTLLEQGYSRYFLEKFCKAALQRIDHAIEQAGKK